MALPSQEIELRSDPSELRLMRAFVSHWAQRCGLGDADCFDACLVATEAVTNAIRHGRAEDDGERPIKVVCRIEDSHLVIEVNDRGTWRSHGETSSADGGRGLYLIRELADAFELRPSPRGTLLRMRLGLRTAQVA
jgi:serine/threonine-protein kinase RsbW